MNDLKAGVKRYRLSYKHGVISAENDRRFFPDSSEPMVLASKYDALAAMVEGMRAALMDARAFVDRHSEPWYISGQELLARIDSVLKGDTDVHSGTKE